jgi:hypothetical protein
LITLYGITETFAKIKDWYSNLHEMQKKKVFENLVSAIKARIKSESAVIS